jgi:hypothetical protein
MSLARLPRQHLRCTAHLDICLAISKTTRPSVGRTRAAGASRTNPPECAFRNQVSDTLYNIAVPGACRDESLRRFRSVLVFA